jgi:hypothetical protein
MIFKARKCSEESGYDHTVFRCWWDSQWIVHNGPLWRLCQDCRSLAKEYGPPTQLSWAEIWNIVRTKDWRGSSIGLWLQRRQQCCTAKKPAHKMDCGR